MHSFFTTIQSIKFDNNNKREMGKLRVLLLQKTPSTIGVNANSTTPLASPDSLRINNNGSAILVAPADSPNNVILLRFPPNFSIFACIHCNAIT
ncbi:hypothetical protein DERP_006207 [Dermatophagoides pteronyssinus]|uniref:Uncharacterized protein n=1 Tax=Dermatophagoides pteronyssinus TaxID=6956 RepID=A0ABQ8IXR4_DERPT|nr:hypothetical protein DERP_006207 [Dermatophagoides pteronyssinus]